MRRGKVIIPEIYIVDYPELILNFLSATEFIPLQVEFIDITREFMYIGYSKDFEDIGDSKITPEYRVTIKSKDNVEVVKMEDTAG